jgi:menaquinol-cytochrome c reductase iron-sulfur subunit
MSARDLPPDKTQLANDQSPCEAAQDPASPPRRSFLAGLLAAGTAGVGALLAIPVVRVVLHPVLAKTTEKSWSDVGKMDDFQSTSAPVQRLVQIEQLDGWRRTVSQKPIYVTRDSAGQLTVLSAVCTHLGCTVPWVEKQNKFICPCHQAIFDPTGKLLGGPAPRRMDVLPMKVEEGVLKVQYQYFRQLTPDKEVVA